MVNMKQSLSPLEQHRRKTRVHMTADYAGRGGSAPRARRSLSKEDEKLLATLLNPQNPIDYIDSTAFREPTAEQIIYTAGGDIAKPDTSWYHPVMDDLSPGKHRTVKSTQQVILTGAQEKVLFHKFNYARFRVSELQKQIWGSESRKPTPDQAEDMLKWYRVSE